MSTFLPIIVELLIYVAITAAACVCAFQLGWAAGFVQHQVQLETDRLTPASPDSVRTGPGSLVPGEATPHTARALLAVPKASLEDTLRPLTRARSGRCTVCDRVRGLFRRRREKLV